MQCHEGQKHEVGHTRVVFGILTLGNCGYFIGFLHEIEQADISENASHEEYTEDGDEELSLKHNLINN
jgi:hypothetical protein